jgi:AcrR family transcriptional regulator
MQHWRKSFMPKLTPARAKAQRERILDAALGCFARQGFQAATMQDIVGASGLSPGAIYGYFAGKTEMVMAIASERHQMERRRMEYAMASSSLEASLQRLLEGFVLELRDPKEKLWRRLAVQLWAESLSNPTLKREALFGVKQAIQALSRLIRKAQKEGRWPRNLNPASAARVMIAILQGISLQLAWDDKIDIASFAVALQIMIEPPAAV